MEQTKEVFIAQYIGHEYIIPSGYRFNGITTSQTNFKLNGIRDGYLSFEGISCFYPNNIGYLALRSVSHLKTKEYRIVAEKLGYSEALFLNGKDAIDSMFDPNRDEPIWNPSDVVNIRDYLISIGICLDESAVAKGWVKLKED